MKNHSFSVIKAVEYGFTTFFRYGTAFLPAGLIYAGFEFGAPLLFKLLFLEHGYALDSMKQILPQDWNLHLIVSHAESILSELETLIEYLPLCIGAGIVYYIISTLLQEGVIQMGFDVYDNAYTRASRVFSWLISIKRALKKNGSFYARNPD